LRGLEAILQAIVEAQGQLPGDSPFGLRAAQASQNSVNNTRRPS
jgi:hypothetical protein